MEGCIFCKIVNREIPAKVVYEDEKIIAFEDINKCAPVHVLVIPKTHIESVLDINHENKDIISDIHIAIGKIAKEQGVAESGFRLINNCGKDAEQTVKHLHYHVIGGRHLGIEVG